MNKLFWRSDFGFLPLPHQYAHHAAWILAKPEQFEVPRILIYRWKKRPESERTDWDLIRFALERGWARLDGESEIRISAQSLSVCHACARAHGNCTTLVCDLPARIVTFNLIETRRFLAAKYDHEAP